jgi:hypothetical protein
LPPQCPACGVELEPFGHSLTKRPPDADPHVQWCGREGGATLWATLPSCRFAELFEGFDTAEAEEQGDGSEDAEATVDEPPEGWDAAQRAGDEGEGQDRNAGEDAELEHPLVADGIDQGAEEGDGEDEVGEGEPVGSVGEEGELDAVLVEGLMDPEEPLDDAFGQEGVTGGEAGEPAGLVFEGDGGEAAEDEAEDEEGEPEADGAEELGLGEARRGLGRRLHLIAIVANAIDGAITCGQLHAEKCTKGDECMQRL